MSLKSNIWRVFSTNFISLISSLVISFVIPIILSIEEYSYLKQYTFFISYITFLSLGYVDGIYLKYGGVENKEVKKDVLKGELNLYWLIQILCVVVFFIISLIYRNIIIFLMTLTIIPVNISGFYKMYYKATGEFKEYTKINYLYTFSYFILNIMLIFIFKIDNYMMYCLVSLISNCIILLICETKFRMKNKFVEGKIRKEYFNHIKVGFFILIGNLSVMLFYAIDRWFIKLFFTTNDFAYYSFAISMLNIINTLVNAISITFYSYIAKGENEKQIKCMKDYFIIIGSFASLGYFIFAAIISLFLRKYEPALSIISISFSTYPYMMVINSIYVNLYKARKDEKKYVKVVFSMVVLSVFYNILLFFIFRTPESIALATTFSFITWYIYSIRDFSYLKINIKETSYLISVFITFIYCSHTFSWIVGGTIYLFILTIATFLIYKDLIRDIFGVLSTRKRKLFKIKKQY